MWKQDLQSAIEICGSQKLLAQALSKVMRNPVSPQQVSYWMNGGRQLPTEYCLPVQYVTAGKVKASAFHPETFLPALFDDLDLDKLVEQIETLDSPARATG